MVWEYTHTTKEATPDNGERTTDNVLRIGMFATWVNCRIDRHSFWERKTKIPKFARYFSPVSFAESSTHNHFRGMKRSIVAVLAVVFAWSISAYASGACCAGGSETACKDGKHAKKASAECPAHASKVVKDAKFGECPVSGEPALEKYTVEHEGTAYHFCCKDCVKKFKKDPAKYLKKG